MTRSQSRIDWWKQPTPVAILIGLSLGAAVLATYSGIDGHDFLRLWDDPDYVTQNPITTQGLTRDGFRRALTTPVQGNWQPLTLLSHMWDVERYGMEPYGHHRTSVLLHVANSILFFVALCFFVARGKLKSTLGSIGINVI